MSDDMLSQEEINALLQESNDDTETLDDLGETLEDESVEDVDITETSGEEMETPQEGEESVEEVVESELDGVETLSEVEKDALGEIGNISMGTAATTLSTLLDKKVNITTPAVSVVTPDELADEYGAPIVAVDVSYKEGLEGSNLMMLQEKDAKVITDLMMGKPEVDTEREISEMDLSAVGEAMNQMMGSSSTSLSEMLDRRIDIKPPIAKLIEISESTDEIMLLQNNKYLVKVSFRMVIEDYIDSSIMQLIPVDFARDIVRRAMGWEDEDIDEVSQNLEDARKVEEDSPAEPSIEHEEVAMEQTEPIVEETPDMEIPVDSTQEETAAEAQERAPMMEEQRPVEERGDMYYNTERQRVPQSQQMSRSVKDDPVTVSEPSFPSFDESTPSGNGFELDLVGDIPVELTVELGRTNKKIGEILEFGIGTVVELDKLVGEPLSIYANGKLLAKGEVVVIDDNFGVRLTEIDSKNQKLI